MYLILLLPGCSTTSPFIFRIKRAQTGADTLLAGRSYKLDLGLNKALITNQSKLLSENNIFNRDAMFYSGCLEENFSRNIFIRNVYTFCVVSRVHLGTKTIKIRQETNIVNFLPHQCKPLILTAQLVSPVSPRLFLLFLFISYDLKDDIRNWLPCRPTEERSHKVVMWSNKRAESCVCGRDIPGWNISNHCQLPWPYRKINTTN